MSDPCHVFVSVGSTATAQQEAFVCAIEARLRAEALVPHTVGRDTFSSDAPLIAVNNLMEKCSGAVVIAFERTLIATGIEKRGGAGQKELISVKLATPWNQIEAAMAYTRKLPLLMIVEQGIKEEGLLERGNDWYVQEVDLGTSALNSLEFNGVLASWKDKLGKAPVASKQNPGEMSIGELAKSLGPAQVWSILTALFALVSGAITLGYKLAKH